MQWVTFIRQALREAIKTRRAKANDWTLKAMAKDRAFKAKAIILARLKEKYDNAKVSTYRSTKLFN